MQFCGAENLTFRKGDQKYMESFGMWFWRRDVENQLDGSCEK